MNTKDSIKVIAIVGPTGTGKTKYATKLAKEFNGELINCDSRQVYKYMDIGTNKGIVQSTPKSELYEGKAYNAFIIENSGVLGWLFDIIEPSEQLSLAEYQKLTYFIIQKIKDRGHMPILIGGTGLYLDALVKGYKLNDIKPNLKLRKELNLIKAPELFERLLKLNPIRAQSLNKSDCKNPRRLIRAIEECEYLDEHKEEVAKSNNDIMKLNLVIIYPDFKREELYNTIDERVLEMVSSGLVEETKKIIQKYSCDIEVLKGIGYKEVIEYLDEKITISQMIADIQQGHKNYAKRQMTWFEGEKRNYNLLKTDFNSGIIAQDIKDAILLQQS